MRLLKLESPNIISEINYDTKFLWCTLKHDKNYVCIQESNKIILVVISSSSSTTRLLLVTNFTIVISLNDKNSTRFFSDQIQYLHMQFYHFRRIWALKRVNERMWVVGKYISNDVHDNDMWSISTLLIYIPLIWDEKQFPLKYSTISYDNDLLSIPHSSSFFIISKSKNIHIDPNLFY